jgi:hypothetical protein
MESSLFAFCTAPVISIGFSDKKARWKKSKQSF